MLTSTNTDVSVLSALCYILVFMWDVFRSNHYTDHVTHTVLLVHIAFMIYHNVSLLLHFHYGCKFVINMTVCNIETYQNITSLH